MKSFNPKIEKRRLKCLKYQIKLSNVPRNMYPYRIKIVFRLEYLISTSHIQ